MEQIALSSLRAHPQNPRLTPREDVVEQIATQIAVSGFDEAHALIVRRVEDGYQIVSGHNRHAAAQKAGLDAVPCWVREMDDATAYMALVLNNAQGELTALERGMHALHSGMDVKAYADGVGRARKSVSNEVLAARVADAVADVGHGLSAHFSQLIEIHAAPKWLWAALVSHMIGNSLTVEATRKLVATLKDLSAPSDSLVDTDAVATAVVAAKIANLPRGGDRRSDQTAKLQDDQTSRQRETPQIC
jgi:ParB family chromosome partitioning protein